MLPPSLLATSSSFSNGAGSTTSMNNAVAAVAIGEGVNLLDWGDSDAESPKRKGDVDSNHSFLTKTNPSSSSSSSSSLVLKERLELSPTRFQELWTSLPDVFSGPLPVATVDGGPASSSSSLHQQLSLSSVEAAVRACHIKVMASGPMIVADEQGLGQPNGSNGMKFFMYGQETDDFLGTEGNILLAQLIIVSNTVVVSRNGVSGNGHDSSPSDTPPLAYTVTVTVKATATAGMGLLDVPAVPNLGHMFAALLQTALTPLGIIR